MADRHKAWTVTTNQGEIDVDFDRPVTLEEARRLTLQNLGGDIPLERAISSTAFSEQRAGERELPGARYARELTQSLGSGFRTLARIGIPIAATVAAGPLGAAAGITSRGGLLGLEALLGGLGEAGTQAVGLAEPSPTQIGLAAGAPLAGRGAGGSMGFLQPQ